MQVIPIETIRTSACAAVRAGRGLEVCPMPIPSEAASCWLEIYARVLSFVIRVENCGIEDVLIPEHVEPCGGAGLAYYGQCIQGFAQLGTDDSMTPDCTGDVCRDFERADRFLKPSMAGGEHG